MRKKLQSRGGFTLTELLTAVAILGLLAAAVAVGIPAAMRIQRQSTAISEAQTLCATLTTAMTDELRYATSVSTEDGAVRFNSAAYGRGVSFGDAGGRITLGGLELLSERAYTSGLTAGAGVDYDGGCFTLTVTVSGSDGPLAESTVRIDPLNAS